VDQTSITPIPAPLSSRKERRQRKEAEARARRSRRLRRAVAWCLPAAGCAAWLVLWRPTAAIVLVVAGWMAFVVIVWNLGPSGSSGRGRVARQHDSGLAGDGAVVPGDTNRNEADHR
jgi:hypothetical protein